MLAGLCLHSWTCPPCLNLHSNLSGPWREHRRQLPTRLCQQHATDLDFQCVHYKIDYQANKLTVLNATSIDEISTIQAS